MSVQYASVGNHSPVSVPDAHEPVSPVSPVSPVESPWDESRETLPESPAHRVSYGKQSLRVWNSLTSLSLSLSLFIQGKAD